MNLIRAEEERIPAAVPEAAPERRATTYVREALNVEVRNRTALFECDWTGTVTEITLKADSQDFRVRVTNERGELYNETYGWFVTHGQEIEDAAAFEAEGVHVLHLRRLKFNGYFKFEVIPGAPLTVSLFIINIEKAVS